MKFSADFIIIKRIRREKNDDDFKCTMLNDKRFNYLRNFYEIKKKHTNMDYYTIQTCV